MLAFIKLAFIKLAFIKLAFIQLAFNKTQHKRCRSQSDHASYIGPERPKQCGRHTALFLQDLLKERQEGRVSKVQKVAPAAHGAGAPRKTSAFRSASSMRNCLKWFSE